MAGERVSAMAELWECLSEEPRAASRGVAMVELKAGL